MSVRVAISPVNIAVMYSADEWAVSSFLERAPPAHGIIIQAAPEYFSTSEIFVRDNTYFMSVASLYTLGAPQYYRVDDGTRALPISYSGCFSIYWYKRVTAKAIVAPSPPRLSVLNKPPKCSVELSTRWMSTLSANRKSNFVDDWNIVLRDRGPESKVGRSFSLFQLTNGEDAFYSF